MEYEVGLWYITAGNDHYEQVVMLITTSNDYYKQLVMLVILMYEGSITVGNGHYG